MLNIELLRAQVKWVEEQDRLPGKGEWNQAAWLSTRPDPNHVDKLRSSILSRWDVEDGSMLADLEERNVCGTAYCVAGHLASEAGVTSTLTLSNGVTVERIDPVKVRQKFPAAIDPLHDIDWRAVGAAALGLTPRQVAGLFDASNTAKDIRRIAERIAADHGMTL